MILTPSSGSPSSSTTLPVITPNGAIATSTPESGSAPTVNILASLMLRELAYPSASADATYFSGCTLSIWNLPDWSVVVLYTYRFVRSCIVTTAFLIDSPVTELTTLPSTEPRLDWAMRTAALRERQRRRVNRSRIGAPGLILAWRQE